MKRPSANDLAAEWIVKLSQPSIGNDELHAFFAWRRDPGNLAAYNAASKAYRRSRERFRVEPDPFGFSVIDIRTGEAAEFATRPQAGISEADAEAIADVLNRRALTDPTPARH
ncbi:MAG: hypothetical protein KKE02_24200 [Alphaproteobacteria bacterium]|nr:hypothetical protein [Alphaproteobacteria bacterium]MBU1516525.1 hypothetical protein [Alphaproteobacteria bacterium]MBU2094282.1 hypothetical protein [Alphaproteobacteria bacterium]MBU2154141.1 hypothetical protein [Alphaproteobacteria bacterium]MBU2307452.1 hypothetical protein [Alphaproteobacteria bacterium]